VSRRLRGRNGDLMFRTRMAGREAYIWSLIEHQSTPDRLMAFRCQGYRTAFWGMWLDKHKKNKNAHKKLFRFPMVIMLVVYCSPEGRRWTGALDMADLIDLPEDVREALGDLVPRSRYILDDVSAQTVEELTRRSLPPVVRLLLVLLRVVPDNPDLVQALLEQMPIPRAAIQVGGKRLLEAMLTYIYAVNAGRIDEHDLDPVYEKLGPEAKEIAVTIAEQLKAEGRVEGRVEGRIEGHVESVLTLAAAKFGSLPAWVRRVVGAASVAQLDAWTVRALTASTPEEMFGP
jgi:predicted transposase YdaD